LHRLMQHMIGGSVGTSGGGVTGGSVGTSGGGGSVTVVFLMNIVLDTAPCHNEQSAGASVYRATSLAEAHFAEKDTPARAWAHVSGRMAMPHQSSGHACKSCLPTSDHRTRHGERSRAVCTSASRVCALNRRQGRCSPANGAP